MAASAYYHSRAGAWLGRSGAACSIVLLAAIVACHVSTTLAVTEDQAAFVSVFAPATNDSVAQDVQGAANACSKYYTVKDGDICFNIWNTFGLSSDQFYALNPGIDCDNLQIGQQVCIQGGVTPPPPDGQWKDSFATWYEPNGNLGACEKPLQNDDMIVALGIPDMGGQFPYPNCGKCMKVQCVGPMSGQSGPACKNNQVIQVKVMDACEACAKDGHRDLSRGAFDKIAVLDAGVVKIKYAFVNC
eukprot:TRINITY_DN1778_c1_g1_i1.p1 TRINITY_DN1778_c1_g1~~TRINITY_DN1778_c1_g1_i1.p1  ORF type:complete len:245 (-),score=55.01 TRINITY_DN1778_c1_g1_i1:499-1233(-)